MVESTTPATRDLRDLSLTELENVLAGWGEPRFRAKQLYEWLWAKAATSLDQMTNLSKDLRARLAEHFTFHTLQPDKQQHSADGTLKSRWLTHDGHRIESVLIPVPAEDRFTVCVSTQVGCSLTCAFCATGRMGRKRNLTAAEIFDQVALVNRQCLDTFGKALTNVVYMGMGEPLLTYANTLESIERLTTAPPKGLGMAARRITVSTVGLVPEIRRLGEDFGGKIGLAVSLHAPSDAIRQRIVPMNRRYPMAELLAALRRYPLPKRRRITIEYTLIAGLNDSLADARALVSSLAGLRVKVNLIPMNPVTASPLRASTPERVAEFREALARAGLSCFVRVRRGDDVDAACGQLALSRELADRARVRPK